MNTLNRFDVCDSCPVRRGLTLWAARLRRCARRVDFLSLGLLAGLLVVALAVAAQADPASAEAAEVLAQSAVPLEEVEGTPEVEGAGEALAPAQSPVPPVTVNDFGEADAAAEEVAAALAAEAAAAEAAPSDQAFEILGIFVEPGSVARVELDSSESFAGARLQTPILVAHGSSPGPTLCLTAGIHGDEVNGVEVVRRLMLSLNVKALAGTLVAVPIANPSAFLRGSRYLLDRRDLNRYFPGRPRGSSASRIAHDLFENVIRGCDSLIDLHTGSFKRTNFHQLRANLSHETTASLAASFGALVVINSAGRPGTLRRAATDVGIPAITVEAGAPGRFEEEHVADALDGIGHLLSARGMLLEAQLSAPRPETTAYLRTRWIRSDQGGILVSRVNLGENVEIGQVLGTISDPLSDEVDEVISPIDGRVIGMALDQLVMPGFAAYHIGFESRPLGTRIPAVAGAAEEALEETPEGVDLEDRPE